MSNRRIKPSDAAIKHFNDYEFYAVSLAVKTMNEILLKKPLNTI